MTVKDEVLMFWMCCLLLLLFLVHHLFGAAECLAQQAAALSLSMPPLMLRLFSGHLH
jgi:hypothetical protein